MDAWKQWFVVLCPLMLLGCKSEAPCTIVAESLDFEEVDVEASVHRRIVVTNPSDVDREVTAVPLAPPFFVHPLDTLGLQAHSEEAWTVTFGPDDALLHFDELILAGGGSCDFALSLRGLGSGDISVSPETIGFTLATDQREEKEVLIRNTRRTPTTVTLQLSIDEGPADALSLGTPTTLEVPAGQAISVPIVAMRRGWGLVRARLSVLAGPRPRVVSILIEPSSPRLEVTPTVIDIPQIGFDLSSQPLGFAERAFRVRNVGTSGDPNAPRLQIVRATADDEVEVSWPQLLPGLAEGESTELTVRMTPRSLGQKRYSVGINAGPFAFQEVVINTRANLLPPCAVQATPAPELLLEDKGDGGLEGVVTFTNTSSEYCVVDNPRFSFATPSQFAMIEGEFSQGEIAPGNQHRVTIAGPKSTNAGIVGAFGFHVFSPNSRVEWIDLRSP